MGGPAEQAFGEVLRQLRREKKLSQERLAELSGVTRGYLSLLERGINSPTLAMLFVIARALETTPTQLLSQVEVRIGVGVDPGQVSNEIKDS